MSCGHPLLRTCIGAPLVQREAGELVDYTHIRHLLTKKPFLMDLMDKRVDKKKMQSGNCRFRRFFVRQAEQGASSDTEKISTKYMRSSSDISSRREEMASTSGIYSENLGEEFVGDNGSLLSLQPWIFKRTKCSKREEGGSDSSGAWNFDWSDFSWTSHGSPRRINPSSNWIGSKKRQENRYNFKPVTFAENFFMPNLCSENVGVEEYTFSSLPSSHVKDESLSCLIGRSKETSMVIVDSFAEQTENRHDKEIGPGISSKKVYFDQIGGSVSGKLTTVIGVPHIPARKSRKVKRENIKAMLGSLDASRSKKMCKITDPLGSLDGMLFFLLGVAVGVTSSVLSNRIEVEKLNKLLKDNKNLVQDLHEELEMKDSLTVKELGSEADRNKEHEQYNLKFIDALQNQNSKCHAAALNMDDYDNVCMTKVGENPEALTKIEAELEAELERLEQNINASSIGQRSSDLSELDLELIANVVQGELREDLLINGAEENLTDDNKDASTTATTHPYNANYSVSPKELSLKLHKVIENRLEERIKELEIELKQSQMKLKLAEAEGLSSKPPSSSDTGSSNHDSPNSLKKNDPSLPLDLSGDALIAYDEAYEELMRLAETEDEKVPSSISNKEKPLLKEDGDISEKEQAREQIMCRTGSYDISGTDDDEDSFDEGKLLIQKIMEKTKQGSPALLNAQRMFFLMDL